MSPKRQPDFARMLDHVQKAQKGISDAVAELSPVTAIRATDAAVFGHLRNLEAGLASVVEFIQQTHAFKEGSLVQDTPSKTQPVKK